MFLDISEKKILILLFFFSFGSFLGFNPKMLIMSLVFEYIATLYKKSSKLIVLLSMTSVF